MVDTNYVASIVKILENPKQTVVKDKITTTEFRVQLPQARNTRIVNLVFWGNLARDVANYYQVNDYIMVEGYLSLRTKLTTNLTKQNLKKVQITAWKVYPFLLGNSKP